MRPILSLIVDRIGRRSTRNRFQLIRRCRVFSSTALQLRERARDREGNQSGAEDVAHRALERTSVGRS